MSKLPFPIFFYPFLLFFLFFLFLFFSSPFLFLSLFSSSPYPFAHLIPSPSSRLFPNSAYAAAAGVRPRLLRGGGLAPPPPPTGLCRHWRPSPAPPPPTSPRRHLPSSARASSSFMAASRLLLLRGGPPLLLPLASAATSRAPPTPPPLAFTRASSRRPSFGLHLAAPPRGQGGPMGGRSGAEPCGATFSWLRLRRWAPESEFSGAPPMEPPPGTPFGRASPGAALGALPNRA